MATMAELLKQKKAQIAAKSGGGLRTIKPAQGKSVIRILPSWRGPDEDGNPQPFWHDFGEHWIKTTKGGKPVAVFVCPEKTYEKECEVCAAIGAAVNHSKDIGDEDTEALLKDSNAQQQFLMNVLVLSDKENKDTPQVMAMGSKLFDSIIAIMVEYAEEDIEITDIDAGVNLVIERSGKGFETTYTAMPSPKGQTAVADGEEVMTKLNNLDELIAAEASRGNESKALNGLATAAGLLAPPEKGTKGIADLSDVEDFDEEDQAEDAEFEDVEDDVLADIEEEVEEPAPKKAPAKKAPAKKAPAKKAAKKAEPEPAEEEAEDDDDEIDALLADLDVG